MNIQASVICHVGHVRSSNEDNYYLQGQMRQDLDQLNSQAQFAGTGGCTLFAVADGMGGEAKGEFASLVAVKSLQACSIEQVYETVICSINRANDQICHEMDLVGYRIGTTLVALYIDAGKAILCNVGDSRGYLLRNGCLSQLSVDHTQVQQMMDLGVLTPEEARNHPNRNVLSQHLGIREDEMIIQPFFSKKVELQEGDTFLLCSDGLTDMVADEVIRDILSEGTAEHQTQLLVEQALANGGRDNITALVVKMN